MKDEKIKKEFISWFLKTHQLKQRECVWYVTKLRDVEGMAELVEFVDNIDEYEHAIEMTAFPLLGPSVKYKKYGKEIADRNDIHEMLAENKKDKLYIKLNYREKEKCLRYPKVKYENFDNQKMECEKMLEQIIKETGEKIRQRKNELEKDKIKKMIDEALDNGNKERFMELTDELKKM